MNNTAGSADKQKRSSQLFVSRYVSCLQTPRLSFRLKKISVNKQYDRDSLKLVVVVVVVIIIILNVIFIKITWNEQIQSLIAAI